MCQDPEALQDKSNPVSAKYFAKKVSFAGQHRSLVERSVKYLIINLVLKRNGY